MANPKRSTSALSAFSRGSALWLQQAKLLAGALVAVLIASFAAGLLVAFAYFFLACPPDTRYLAFKHQQALLQSFIPFANNTVSLQAGDVPGAAPLSLSPDDTLAFTRDADEQASVFLHNAILYGGLSFVVIFVLSILFWIEYGSRKLSDQQVRGATLVNAKTLVKQMRQRNDASPYRIAGVPMRAAAENLGTLIAGAQGTGKSQQFFSLMTQCRKRQKRAIVYDPSGEFTAAFYREGKDVMLNPFDRRSPNWNPWREIGHDIHYDSLAEGLIPIPPNVPDPFFAIAGRNVFKDTLRALGKSGKRTNAMLYQAIARSNLEELHAILAGESAASYVDPITERTGMSLKMTVQNQLDCFRFLHDEGEPFSIREWMQNEDDDSWLFITVNEEQKSALLPIISLWNDIAIRALLTLKPVHRERHWYFLDELPTLQKLEIMKLAVTNTRKFGGCFVLGIQDFSQLYQIYGEHLARTIISGCQTKLLLRVTDGEAAKALALAIGQADLDEKEESLNLGIDERRDGMSVFARRNLRDLVLSSEILHLPDMHGYLVTPSDYPIARVKYKRVIYPQTVPPFLPRETPELWVPPSVRPGGGSPAAAIAPASLSGTPASGSAAVAPSSGSPQNATPAGAGTAPTRLASGEEVDPTTGEIRRPGQPTQRQDPKPYLGDLLG
ncbi:type IV secretion system DNA-binding domain-containing protein [Burkholderia glumae]|uniref:type IV secretion system DNA-binding domain-containing protein n=1 Tax=Burkholderia glumae TaxID=337 RepID=UPI002036AB6C|nr:type IV secretion system DNA-binding domain-containing protein [Burkholderia glumae]